MTQGHPLPPACQSALAAIEADPLALDPGTLAHLRHCPACAEARVHWLALEEAPHALAPAGYFEQLPDRVMRKLPAKSSGQPGSGRWLWAAAAILLMTGVGLTGFWLGRVQRAPLVEASLPRAQELITESETPFHDEDDALYQLSTLPQAEAEAVLKRMEGPKPENP